MDKYKLKTGIITERQLLNTFATSKQKEKYNKDGGFKSSHKETLLNEASRYCNIKDLGDKTYEITDVLLRPIPKSLNKMTTGLYQYIIPLVLYKLIDGHDENNKIQITCNKLARQIEMVNSNYNMIKFNKETTANYFDMNENDVCDFYEKADDMINYYIMNSLSYLQKSGCVIWRDVHKVRRVSEEIINISNNSVVMDVNIKDTQATEEEMKFYTECIKKVDDKLGIKNNKERFYSKKANQFNKMLSELLSERGIRYIYKAYEVYYIHLDWCSDLLKKFNLKNNEEQFIENFNTEFQNIIMENAQKRFNKNEKEKLKKYSENYLDTFMDLCDITIQSKTESIRDRLRIDENSHDYDLKISIKREDK